MYSDSWAAYRDVQRLTAVAQHDMSFLEVRGSSHWRSHTECRILLEPRQNEVQDDEWGSSRHAHVVYGRVGSRRVHVA